MVSGRFIGVLIVILLGVAGCLETPSSPIGAAPQLLIDYIRDVDDIQIVVKGIDDHLFSNITIQINEEEFRENHTYLHTVRTSRRAFDLSISVWDEDQGYSYAANFTLEVGDETVAFLIVIPDDQSPNREKPPYRTILEKIK